MDAGRGFAELKRRSVVRVGAFQAAAWLLAYNGHFSEDIPGEIFNALALVPQPKVAARTSAFAFKDKEEGLRKVGQVLDVATVLEGSVQRAGDQVRITAPLIDARSGYRPWPEACDRRLAGIFAVEAGPP